MMIALVLAIFVVIGATIVTLHMMPTVAQGGAANVGAGYSPTVTATKIAGSAMLTPTTMAAPTPTVATAGQPGNSAWAAIGPTWTDSVTINPALPSHVVYCGAPSSGQIAAGFSTDGGVTYNTVSLNIIGGGCAISIDPTNASDLLMTVDMPVTGPFAGESDFPMTLWRSGDGGKTWHQQIFTGTTSTGVLYSLTGVISWQGSTAYVAAGSALAVSVHGGPFTMVKAPEDVSNLLVLPGVIVTHPECQMPCSASFISQDAGQHWQNAAWSGCPVNQSTGVNQFNIVTASFDGHTLMAMCAEQQTTIIVISRDNGTTWQQVPSLQSVDAGIPVGAAFLNFVGPDGTLYVEGTDPATAKFSVMALAPNSATWKFVAIADNPLTAVTWNSAGKLTSLWEPDPNNHGFLIQHLP